MLVRWVMGHHWPLSREALTQQAHPLQLVQEHLVQPQSGAIFVVVGLMLKRAWIGSRLKCFRLLAGFPVSVW